MRVSVAFLLFLLPLFSSAQNEIENLNTLFHGRLNFEENKKGITVEFLKNGEVFRSDVFKPEKIDGEKLRYEKEENGIILECLDYYPKCFDRKVEKTKSRQPYSRLLLHVRDLAEADSVITEMKSLIAKE